MTTRLQSPRTFRMACKWLAGAGLTLGLLGTSQAQVAVFQENFASSLGQFTSTGSVTTGTYGARLRASLTGSDGSITSSPISTVGFTSLTLTFTRSTTSLDSGEAGIAAFSVDGTNYTTIESTQSASGATTLTLPSIAAGQSALRLRFRVAANSTTEYYTVDSIVLQGASGPTDPGGGGTLPPVSSVDADGPFTTTADTNTGPTRAAWVVRPTTLGANGLKHPIFIWGPGAGTGPSNYDFHLRRIASHGFAVYSITSTGDGTEMKAAIDWLIAENNRAASPYYQKLDTTKIALGGHSRGSVSTFAAGGDSRLTTTIHVAGGSFDGQGSANLKKPTAYICGEEDTTATPNCERDYSATRVPFFFTVMDGVTHTQAARSGLPAIISWLRWHLGGETSRRDSFLSTGGTFRTGTWDSQSKNW
jgi:hypothetical protein